MSLKDIIKKLIYKEKYNSETYVKYLRKLGMSIGEETIIYEPRYSCIDQTRPWLITIGDNVKLTMGVTLLTHGYDWSVLKNLYGDVLGSSGKIVIGNNVFIGMNSTVLKGVTIGDNVIIGANSLVNKNVPSNVVAAGNPAKIIMTIEDYYERRKKLQYDEASEMVRLYRERYEREPDDEALREFFWLFEDDPDKLSDVFKAVNELNGTAQMTNDRMRKHHKLYNSREEFLASIR